MSLWILGSGHVVDPACNNHELAIGKLFLKVENVSEKVVSLLHAAMVGHTIEDVLRCSVEDGISEKHDSVKTAHCHSGFGLRWLL
jgi:hypothetical protein